MSSDFLTELMLCGSWRMRRVWRVRIKGKHSRQGLGSTEHGLRGAKFSLITTSSGIPTMNLMLC